MATTATAATPMPTAMTTSQATMCWLMVARSGMRWPGGPAGAVPNAKAPPWGGAREYVRGAGMPARPGQMALVTLPDLRQRVHT